MEVGVGQLENRLAGFFERPLSRHANIGEQMRIIGEAAKHFALPVPCPAKAPATQFLAEPSSRAFLMT